ncbi:MAG: homocysteine S-methyltransferase family protein [Deltaproteobacteria bacterium]|nr:homocysteine S-methyltransferase family protein [Deltaproteobacteria bacterium]MBW2530899.1 homocysteine S-methyltransferase family protein [Deltaproteobacteria bacterium]
MGTLLIERGVPAPPPLWSAWALLHRPEQVAAIHREYAAAGARVHTANTFRAKRRSLGDRWQEAARAAVDLARGAVPQGHRIAGSIAPLEDCYRPDLSPAQPRAEHRELAWALADAGVDLLLCETFPHAAEARIAVEEAAATGVETWVALTAGPMADLMTPEQVVDAAAGCVRAGARAALVNCVSAVRTLPYVEALAQLDAPVGAYANAGARADGLGWPAAAGSPGRYAALPASFRQRLEDAFPEIAKDPAAALRRPPFQFAP